MTFDTDLHGKSGFLVVALGCATGAALGLLGWGLEMKRRFALSQQRAQTIFNNLREGVVVVNRDRNVAVMNQAATELNGGVPETMSREAVEKTIAFYRTTGELLTPEEWPSALGFRGEFLENEEFHLERKRDRQVVNVEISTAPILNSRGKVEQVMVRYRDIGPAKVVDEAMLQLAAIVESSEDAIIGKDTQGVVTSWNRGAERIFGYTTEEMVGRSIKLLLPDERMTEEEDILERIRRGETVEHIETERKTKSGKTVQISLTVSPIRDAEGRIRGASKIARNITERKKLEFQLLQSQKMEAIGQLTGGISHDFNNLLGIVIGNLDLLERQVQDNDAALKRVQVAQKAALRGAKLTRRLLTLSMGEELKPTSINVNHTIRNTVELAQRVLGPEIKVGLQLAENMPRAHADLAGVESALLNLVVNARDAMPRGGTLSLTSSVVEVEEAIVQGTALLAPGRYAYMSVSDTGTGMTPEVAQRAFEPFYTTKPAGKGTGLGLATVYGFFKQSGGTVRIYSEVGFGTTVSLYLPLAGESVAVEEPRVGEACSMGEGSVLVVDDEEDLLEIAMAYLKEMGYVAYKAIDGASAMQRLRTNPEIGLLITDILMPGGMNGVELAKSARDLNPKLKVIYCSGFPAASLSERNMPVVDEPLLRKPYQQAEFSAMVHGTLDEPIRTTYAAKRRDF